MSVPATSSSSSSAQHTAPMWNGTDPLPAGHTCRCYGCAPDRLPPRNLELTVEDAVHGYWRAGGLPLVDAILLDGTPNSQVEQCLWQGRELWALVVSAPVHRCQACHGNHACRTVVFPRQIDLVVNAFCRTLWRELQEGVAARQVHPPAGWVLWERHGLGPRCTVDTGFAEVCPTHTLSSHAWACTLAAWDGDMEAAQRSRQQQYMLEARADLLFTGLVTDERTAEQWACQVRWTE